MRRFFVEDIDESSKSVRVKGEEFIHLKKVLRLKAASPVAVFNGSGLELTGVIESIGPDFASINIKGCSKDKKESPVRIILLQGLVKGEKPELIVQKATELGVSGIHFYSTSRTIPVISEEKSVDKITRLRKVAIEAAKQCGRTIIPLISFVDLDEALGIGGDLKLFFWEGERSRGIKEAIKGPIPSPPGEVVVLTGPEGGLSAEDAARAVSKGFVPVSLGPRILRAETAAIAAVSILQYELGDML